MWREPERNVRGKSKDERKEVPNEDKRVEEVAEEPVDEAGKRNHGNAESETDRSLSILWSDVQHTNADKVSLLCNKTVVSNDEPKKPKEKLQLGGIPGDARILPISISEKICESLRVKETVKVIMKSRVRESRTHGSGKEFTS